MFALSELMEFPSDIGDSEATNGKHGILPSGISEELVYDVYQADDDNLLYKDGSKMSLIDGK